MKQTLIIACSILFGCAIFVTGFISLVRHLNQPRVDWCHEHGYKAVDQSGRDGRFVFCVDDQRRMILPEE